MSFDRMDAAERREALRHFALFRGMDDAVLAALAAEARPLRLAIGEHLFHEGDVGESLYLLVRGRLRVLVRDGREEPRFVGEVNPGETIGEMAPISGEPRSAAAQAVRDSDLLEIPAGAFERLLARSPAAMLELTRLIVRRHRSNLHGRAVHPRLQNLTLFPASADADPPGFADVLSDALAPLGRTAIFRPPDGPPATPRLLERAARMERDHDFLLYPCSREMDDWSRFALSQADRILILCPAGSDPSEGRRRADALRGLLARREVVVVHPADTRPAGTAAWCLALETADRHHVRRGSPGSLRRLARLVTGRGRGLVLGGGGARAFCHVGLLQALESHGVPVDHVGGTSMGGILAAQIASGRSAGELKEWILSLRRDGLLRNDFTLPLYSVIAGRHFAKIFRRWAGDLDMEDLWLDCFCVSANLTKARQEVHRTGKVRHVCRATGALPGLLPPIHLDGNLLVDGAVLNNVPVDVMAAMDRGRVIASRVTPRSGPPGTLGPDDLVSGWEILWNRLVPFSRGPELPSIAEIIVRSSFLGSAVSQAAAGDLADFGLDFELPRFGLIDWESAEAIIDESTELAMRAVEEWCAGDPGLAEAATRGGPPGRAPAGDR